MLSVAHPPRVRLAGASARLGTLVPVERVLRPSDPEDLAERLRANGFATVSVTSEEPAALAAGAAKDALGASGTSPDDVAAVVYGTCSYWGRSRIGVSTAPDLPALVQQHVLAPLGLERAKLWAVWLAESGNFASVLRVARALLRETAGAKPRGRVLCLVADGVPDGPDEYRAMPNAVTVNGDGAGACVLGLDGEGDGDGGTWVVEALGQVASVKMTGYVKGQGFQKHLEIMKGIRSATSDVYRRLGASGDDYRWLVTNSYSVATLGEFADMAGVGRDRVWRRDAARTGHLFTADLPFGLVRLAETGNVDAGDQVLCLSSGPSTWGAVSLRRT